jgi:DNA polymerase-3 subunit gamma/tau
MLSSSSFNALLKSIEEPPPHVVFMMATTEPQKIPDTVLSRAQVYELRTLPARTIADRLRYIAGEEGLEIDDAGLQLLARAGEGSMRDALSALDQVRAFAGDHITSDDVVTVLGLIGRDVVLDMLEAVAAEDAPAAFALVERAIERGNDVRLLCRELARATRDLLILSVDRSRADDPEIASEGERERLKHLASLCSREDLLRAFDVLTKTEQDIRASDQPRYSLEMALLRLMHLRKLVPLAELLASGASGANAGGARSASPTAPPARAGSAARVSPTAPLAPLAPAPLAAPAEGSDLKNAFLAQVKAAKVFFYNTVVAQAYRIDVSPSKITFTFLPNQKVPRQQCEEMKPLLEDLAQKVAGRRVPVAVTVADATGMPGAPAAPAAGTTPPPRERDDESLRREAMSDPSVQALFEIFPVQKSKVEEL